MKNNLTSKLICLLLSLALLLTAAAGCKRQEEKNPASSSSSDTVEQNSSEPEEPEEPTETDEPSGDDEGEDSGELDELDNEPDDAEYTELVVNNTTVINEKFRGLNGIHQLYNYIPDIFNRTYNEKQIALEKETFQKMGTKMIRSYFGSALAWDSKRAVFDFESEAMTAFYRSCRDMQDIDVEVGLTAQWSLRHFLNGNVNAASPVSFECAGFYVQGDFDATCRNYRDFMAKAVLAIQAHGVRNVKYFFAYTECNNTFNSENEHLSSVLEKRDYERVYPIFDKAITALDGSLKDSGLRSSYKIVGPCDNWRNDQGEEEYSRLVKYTLENLSDKVDIIGSHNGYDRAVSYLDDMYYELPSEKNSEPMLRAKQYGKEYWIDEYDVEVTFQGHAVARENNAHPWRGVALGAMTNAVMNMSHVNNVFLWTLYEQQWPDSTNDGVNSEFNNGIQIGGYLPSLLETTVPYPAWYSYSMLCKHVGTGKLYGCEPGDAAYISCIQRDDGEWTVVVTNYDYEDKQMKISFEQSMGGKTFYRYLYHTNTIKPVAGNDMLKASAVAKSVKTGFYDTLPGGSVAVYTTAKP